MNVVIKFKTGNSDVINKAECLLREDVTESQIKEAIENALKPLQDNDGGVVVVWTTSTSWND